MSDPSDFWYRLGYTFESTLSRAPTGTLRSLASRKDEAAKRRGDKDARPARSEPEEGGEDGGSALEVALATGAGALGVKLLKAWPGRGVPGAARLGKAAMAGAVAALLRELVVPWATGEERVDPGEVPERLIAGSARGLLYAAVVEPRLPGPSLLRGLVYGGAEYMLSPYGGARGLLGRLAPYRQLPVVGGVLDDAAGGETTLADHLVFAAALAVLYGEDGFRIGMGDEAE